MTHPREDEEIFRDIYSGLRRFAAVVGDRDMDPDDLVQEAVARTLHVGPLARLEDPSAYLRTAILRIVSNERRRFAMRRRAFTTHMPLVVVGSDDSYPSDLADLFALPAHWRAILYLHEVEGHEYSAIAEVVGMTPGAARKLAERARRRLRSSIVRESRR